MDLQTLRAATRLLTGIARDLQARPHVGAVLPPTPGCGTDGPGRAEEPDPLIYHEKKVPSWVSVRERARRPAVGHAQAQLNAFLRLLDEAARGAVAGELARLCRGNTAEALKLRAKLPSRITVDCRFGDQTELATRVFQTCQGLKDDGRIGPETWRLLNAVPRPPTAGQVVVGQSGDGLLAIIRGFIGVADLALLAERTAFPRFTRTSLIVGHAGRAGTRLSDRVDDPSSVDSSRAITAVFHARAGALASRRPVLLVMSGIHPQETAAGTPGARVLSALEDSLRRNASPWLEHFNVVLMPNVNPGGSRRENASGVNLNRNFFGLAKERGGLAARRPLGECEPHDAPNVPRAPDAARQPETQVIMDIIAAIRPNAIVALHGTRNNPFEGVFIDAPPDVTRAARVIQQTAAIARSVVASHPTRFRGNELSPRRPTRVLPKLDPIAFLYQGTDKNVVWPDQTQVGPFSLGSWASCGGYPVFTVEPQFLGTPLPSAAATTLASALERSIRPN